MSRLCWVISDNNWMIDAANAKLSSAKWKSKGRFDGSERTGSECDRSELLINALALKMGGIAHPTYNLYCFIYFAITVNTQQHKKYDLEFPLIHYIRAYCVQTHTHIYQIHRFVQFGLQSTQYSTFRPKVTHQEVVRRKGISLYSAIVLCVAYNDFFLIFIYDFGVVCYYWQKVCSCWVTSGYYLVGFIDV